MAHRIPECRHGLARQNATGSIGHGAGNHDRQALAGLFKESIDGKQRRLAVQRVENRFDQQYVGTAFHQAARLLKIRRRQLVESHIAGCRIIHVGRNRRGFRRRAKGAGDKTRLVRRRIFVAGGARQARRRHVHFIGQMRHVVIVLRYRSGAKRITFNDVCTGGQILFMDFADDMRLRQRE